MSRASNNQRKFAEPTETKAYNTNSVAFVQMASTAEELLDADVGTKDSFVHVSDPLRLKASLVSFEFNVIQGKESLMTTLELLNPTTEFEEMFMRIYDKIYPERKGVISSWSDEVRRRERMNNTTGDSEALSTTDPAAFYPYFYLRWGYGTRMEEGLSKTHKVKLVDVEYRMTATEDKRVTIKFVDQHSFTKESNTFNKRPESVKVNCYNDEGELKKVGHILEEIFTGFLASYPEVVPFCSLYSSPDNPDETSYGDFLDSVAETYARSAAYYEPEQLAIAFDEADKQRSQKLYEDPEAEHVSFLTTSELFDYVLSDEEKKKIIEELPSKLAPVPDYAPDMVGKITETHRLKAYNELFKSLGIDFTKQQVQGDGTGTPGKPANNQTSNDVDVVGNNSDSDVQNRALAAENSINKDITVNVFTPSIPRKDFTFEPKPQGQESYMAFWPLGVKPPRGVEDFGSLNRKIAPLTPEEKQFLEGLGVAPILVRGVVNQNQLNPRDQLQIDQDRFTFSIDELNEQWSRKTYEDAVFESLENPNKVGDIKYDVSLPIKPVALHSPLLDFSGFYSVPMNTGPGGINIFSPTVLETTVSGVGGALPIPLWDFCSQDWVTAANIGLDGFVELPGVEVTVASGCCGFGGNITAYSSWLQQIINEPEKILNTMPVYLEPTLFTYSHMMNLASQLSAETQDQTDPLDVSGTPTSLPSDLSTKLPDPSKYEAIATLQTDLDNPHITNTIQGLVRSINNIVIGNPSKLRFTSIDFSTPTPEKKEAMFENSILKSLPDDAKNDIIDNDKTLAAVVPTSLTDTLANLAVQPVNSFPTTRDYREGHEGVLVLDVGAPGSIVTKLQFTGDNRFLIGLSQAMYATRLVHDIDSFFDKQRAMSKTMYLTISNGLAADIEATRARAFTTDSARDGVDVDEELENLENLNLLKARADKSKSDYVMDEDLLSLFPAYVDYFTDKELEEIAVEGAYGEKSAAYRPEELRLLASLVNDPTLLNALFPEADLDGQTNEVSTYVIRTDPYTGTTYNRHGHVNSEIVKKTVLKRQANFTTSREKSKALFPVASKLTDEKFQAQLALLQDAWQVEIDTLGIPELSDLLSDVGESGRSVLLRVFDPRLNSDQPHWISGVYMITRLAHRIDSTGGYTTKMTLLRSQTTTTDLIQGNTIAVQD